MTSSISEEFARKVFLESDLEPLVRYKNSTTPWKAKCLRCGKTVSPTYNKVRLRGHQCGHCSGRIIDPKSATELMKKNGFSPVAKYPGANKPWKSKCTKCKKLTEPTYSNVKKGIGCKFCSNRAVDEKDAVKAMDERGFIVLEPFPGAIKPWLVKCKTCKREFRVPFHSLNTKNRCKYCSGVALDAKTIRAKISELNLIPLEPFPGASIPWRLQCGTCRRLVSPSWTHLTRKDRNVHGCFYCSRRRIHLDDINELLKANKLEPIGPYINGKTPWPCKCLKCKRLVYPRITDLRSGQRGCIYCAGLRIDEREAIKLANKNGFTPLVPYPGAKKGWECVCNICGEVSKPHYTSMQQGINRCKYCATGGFLFEKPAIVYLISNKTLQAHKVGVAGSSQHNERLKKHAKQGWEIYKHKEFKRGIQAFEVEQETLNWLRNELKLGAYLVSTQMPQAGWTETVDSNEIELPKIWEKIEELSRLKK